MNFRSIADLSTAICTNVGKLPRDIEGVVGIPRSGLLAANILALHLNLPLTDVNGLLTRRALATGKRGMSHADPFAEDASGKILVLDDSLCSGSAMAEARALLGASAYSTRILYAAVYVVPGLEHKVDFAFELLDLPRFFEWNFMHHSILGNACVDIDGVLCVDPTAEDNDDGPRYASFLSAAQPLHIPTVRVGKLVTCRLERYRGKTEEWLRKHRVEYDELVMMNVDSMAERRRLGGHGKFKGDVYRDCSASLFIESSASQALQIADISRKPVFCIETGSTVYPSAYSITTGTVRKTQRVIARRTAVARTFLGKWLLRRLSY